MARKPRIKFRTDGSIEGVLLLNVESAPVIGVKDMSVLAFVYVQNPTHAASVKAGTAEPGVFQMFATTAELRNTAALFLRAAEAVEKKAAGVSN